MRQVDYFKFFKAFPEFLDIDETDDVKLLLLNSIKKEARKNKEVINLLPIKRVHWGTTFPKEMFTKEDFMTGHNIYKIKFRREILFTLTYSKESKASLDTSFYRFRRKKKRSRYMDQNEVVNFKRTLLIDNMLK
jgi:hypothetical protein